jgi:dihydropteroate synthase
VCSAVSRKAAQIVRVHEVAATQDALTVLKTIEDLREKAQTQGDQGR